MRTALQGLSIAALCFAVLAAFLLVALHTVCALRGSPASPWTFKSAIPLIAIGLSYLSLILTVPRTPAQRKLGFLVGLAFVFWGAEQYLKNQAVISYLDDIVVFLFVLDLGLVIRKNLSQTDGRRPIAKAGAGTVQGEPPPVD